jgi:hypothetical protein
MWFTGDFSTSEAWADWVEAGGFFDETFQFNQLIAVTMIVV